MPTRHQPPLTVRTIAAEAGVSVATVSKVMNSRPGVAPATRERVERVLQRHRDGRRTRDAHPALIIDLALNELDSLWSLEVVRGAEEALRPAGAALAVVALHGDAAQTAVWLDSLAHRPCHGVILVLTEPNARQHLHLASAGLPVVAMDPVGGVDAGVPTVAATNWTGAANATEHLIALGHRRIAHLAGPRHIMCSRARADGFRSAMRRAALPVPDGWVRHGAFDGESGYAAALALLDEAARAGRPLPTALFAASDHQALGALSALRAYGLSVPGDISVVGFDDLPLTPYTAPPLTTVRQPVADMAAFAAHALLRLIRGDTVDPPRTELPTPLVVRGSTAPPPAGPAGPRHEGADASMTVEVS